MPRKYLMTWIESRQRWMKMHRSKRYVISCKALNVPPTKEASYQAANDWWEKKLAELEMEPPAKDHRVEALRDARRQAPSVLRRSAGSNDVVHGADCLQP